MARCFPQGGIALAPMRHLTQGPFWQILNRYGAPDAYVSEFVRVHKDFTLNPHQIEDNLAYADKCPLWIQLMGNDPDALLRNAEILQKYPIAGIDFNVGCPVPKIYKKQAGGGLLKDLPLLKTLISSLRAGCSRPLSVKMRIGFEHTENFEKILDILHEAQVDFITIHARTVKDRYGGQIRYDFIQRAVEKLPIPIIANGDINTLDDIKHVLSFSRCWGIMLGRAAIRNPWIFSQWRSQNKGQSIDYPRYKHVFEYLQTIDKTFGENGNSNKLGLLKNFCQYIGPAIDGDFLSQILRSSRELEFWERCEQGLLKGLRGEKVFRGEVVKTGEILQAG
ncbi:MAG: tRNA-dihydrouridine synthase family protein [Puniceicoccales bacterium]|jgi:tRNA-dihydrouridine synthase|nr:tRNA-dihydrouridine synthase family protein [Puniceicoccales bacterium]